MYFALIIFLSLLLTGCATGPVYNPSQITTRVEISFNESGLKAVQDGMTLDQVHHVMGHELLIGYESQSSGYKPLTVPNPYKTEGLKNTGYLIEYYIQAIRQPDGIVSDDELMPLIFKNGKLIGRGWPLANSIRPAKPSA